MYEHLNMDLSSNSPLYTAMAIVYKGQGSVVSDRSNESIASTSSWDAVKFLTLFAVCLELHDWLHYELVCPQQSPVFEKMSSYEHYWTPSSLFRSSCIRTRVSSLNMENLRRTLRSTPKKTKKTSRWVWWCEGDGTGRGITDGGPVRLTADVPTATRTTPRSRLGGADLQRQLGPLGGGGTLSRPGRLSHRRHWGEPPPKMEIDWILFVAHVDSCWTVFPFPVYLHLF